MKKRGQTGGLLLSAALTAAAVLCVILRMPAIPGENAVLAAAGFILPGGAMQAWESGFESAHMSQPEETPAPSSSPSSSASSSSAPSSSAEGTLDPSVDNKIKEMTIGNSGVQLGSLWVKNSNKNHKIDIQAELNKQPAVKIKKDGTPQVLIYHTHTTEAYLGKTRSQDKSESVVAVGEQIAAQLRAAGIGVIHDTTMHDSPSYNGSYDRSGETMLRNLKEHPTLQVTLDIHRDAMGAQDGTRIKPTALVNGKKAAQVMIISGCDDNGTLGFPNWEYNLRLAVRMQKSLSEDYPSLARPLNFCNRKYNEHITKGSLLIEVGTEVNTLEESKYSGELLGKAISKTLEQLT